MSIKNALLVTLLIFAAACARGGDKRSDMQLVRREVFTSAPVSKPANLTPPTGSTAPTTGGFVDGNGITGPRAAGSPAAFIRTHTAEYVTTDLDDETAFSFVPAFGGGGLSASPGVVMELVPANNPDAGAADYLIQFSLSPATLRISSRTASGYSVGFDDGANAVNYNAHRISVQFFAGKLYWFLDGAGAPFYTGGRVWPETRYVARFSVYDAGGSIGSPAWYEVRDVLHVTKSPHFLYTKEMQDADFGGVPQTVFYVRVAQMSAIIGPGFPCDAIIDCNYDPPLVTLTKFNV